MSNETRIKVHLSRGLAQLGFGQLGPGVQVKPQLAVVLRDLFFFQAILGSTTQQTQS